MHRKARYRPLGGAAAGDGGGPGQWRPSAGGGGVRLLQQAMGGAPAQPQGRADLADRLPLVP